MTRRCPRQIERERQELCSQPSPTLFVHNAGHASNAIDPYLSFSHDAASTSFTVQNDHLDYGQINNELQDIVNQYSGTPLDAVMSEERVKEAVTNVMERAGLTRGNNFDLQVNADPNDPSKMLINMTLTPVIPLTTFNFVTPGLLDAETEQDTTSNSEDE